MQIVIHLGAHCTDEDRLLEALFANQKPLYSMGIAVPGPARYRPLLREALAKLRGEAATPDMSNALIRHILGNAKPHTLILASDGFVCAPRFVLGQRRIYPMIGDRVKALSGLFPEHEVRFSIGMRNPATLIPALHDAMEAEIGFDRLTAPLDLMALRWSETLQTMRKAVPEARITTWCNEDSPLLWPEILRAVSDHPAKLHLTGTLKILEPLLKPGGIDRLSAYLQERPGLDPPARRKIIGIFLEKFGDPAALEESYDLPGWSESVIWELTRAYEMDMERIADIPQVHLLRV